MPKKRLLQYRHAVVFKGSIAGECKHLHIIGQAGHQCGQYAVTLAGIKREVQYLLQDALAVCAVGQLYIIFAAGQCQPVRNAALFEKCRQRTEFFCRICRAALRAGRGGAEQILALLSCNEVDVLLFFRDPINPKATDVNDMNLLRLCDVHNVPVATNIATAEALILALERGDLDWREVGNPSI